MRDGSDGGGEVEMKGWQGLRNLKPGKKESPVLFVRTPGENQELEPFWKKPKRYGLLRFAAVRHDWPRFVTLRYATVRYGSSFFGGLRESAQSVSTDIMYTLVVCKLLANRDKQTVAKSGANRSEP